MSSFVSGTFVIPSNAPYGSYTFNANGGGLSISEPSAVKIYNNYMEPYEINYNGASEIECILHINEPDFDFYYDPRGGLASEYSYVRFENAGQVTWNELPYSFEADSYHEHVDGNGEIIAYTLYSPFKLYLKYPNLEVAYPYPIIAYILRTMADPSGGDLYMDNTVTVNPS